MTPHEKQAQIKANILGSYSNAKELITPASTTTDLGVTSGGAPAATTTEPLPSAAAVVAEAPAAAVVATPVTE